MTDHAEGFESGLRAWELDVGEWERASGTALADAVKVHSDDGSAALRTVLLQWCYSSRNFAANPTVSAGNVTSADDDRMQVDSLKKGKGGQTPQLARKSHDQHDQHDQHELYRHQHVPEMWQNWTLGEGLLETRWRSIRQFHQ